MQAETRGDAAAAEHYLQAAAAHDIGREPRWALANFYFRQGDHARFLEAANSYRAVTHQHEDGLFRMVAETVPDAQQLSTALPHLGCDELGTAIDVLKARQQPADPLVDTMTANCRDTSSRNTLSVFVSDLLLSDQVVRAGEIWRGMGLKTTLANGDFSQPIAGQGFDWRINESPDVHSRQQDKSLEFEIGDGSASGTVLLFQPVLLQPGQKYRLSMNADADPAAQDAFRWELVELSTGRHLNSTLDAENINLQPVWNFQAPTSTTRTLALALFYRRPAGSLPFAGKFTVHGVQLARVLGS